MDLEALRELTTDLDFDILGRTATVTVKLKTPVATKIIWLTPFTEEVPVEGGFTRREQRLVMALKKADIPTVPKGTQILAPPMGDTANKNWLVDAYLHGDGEHHRVIVVETEYAS